MAVPNSMSAIAPPTPAPAPDAPPTTAAPLGRTTVRGAAMLGFQTLASKGLGIVGQIALAHLLSPEEFGLVGLTFTVVGFAGLLQLSGLKDVLVQRQSQFEESAGTGFWLSLGSGLLASIFIIIAAPLSARAYGNPQLVWLVLLAAAIAPLNALSVVPSAWLQKEMRFRTLAMQGLWLAALGTALSIAFAYVGMGASSLIWSAVGVAAVKCVWTWAAVRWHPAPLRPHAAQLRPLLRDSTLLLGASLCFYITGQGDYIILGRLTDEKVVGVYYFAFMFSTQTMQLVSANLTSVLSPALAKLRNEPARLRVAFLAATRVLAAMAIPLCVLQAALAEPLVRLLFGLKWMPAVVPMQILSVGMAFTCLGVPAGSLIQALGLYRTYVLLAAFWAILFAVVVTAATVWAGIVGTAASVATILACTGIAGQYVVLRYVGGSWRDVLGAVGFPCLATAVSVGSAKLASAVVIRESSSEWLSIAVVGGTAGALYFGLAWVFAPSLVADLRARLRSLLPM